MITRFAPSPTGKLHIGSVRTALFCYLMAAKMTEGKYILRIEDTDTARSTSLFEENICEWFQWLWLDWDAWPGKEDEYGPYYQMKRLEIYNRHVQQLLEDGQAYYARETTEELDALREASQKKKEPFRYRQRTYSPKQIVQFKEEWRKPVIRFKVDPNREVVFTDLVKGETRFVMSQFWDFVIVKSDGIPTYHFAVVVDDIHMQISHVVRGEDHLTNTAKHIVLYEALGHTALPHFAHLPLMMNPSGKKMSKRDDPKDVGLVLIDQFRAAWFLPEAILNFAAMIGRNPGTEQEIFSLEELIHAFDITRVQKANAKYDFGRALWYNASYIKNLSDEDFVTKVKDYIFLYGDESWREIIEQTNDEYWHMLAADIKVRLQTFAQFKDYCQYFFVRPWSVDFLLVHKQKMKITQEMVMWFLPDLIDLLDHITEQQWERDFLKEELVSFIKAKELKNGQVLRPIRAILTWVEASPGAFEMLDILWKEESLVRLREYLGYSKHH